MITELQFKELHQRAIELKYGNLFHYNYDDCKDADVLAHDEQMILLLDGSTVPAHALWASDYPEAVARELGFLDWKIRVSGVPPQHIEVFEQNGFSIYAEYNDYFNYELHETANQLEHCDAPRLLLADEMEYIYKIAAMCKGQTRGFEAEKPEWFMQWLESNDIIIVEKDGDVVGYCCVAVYNNGENLWIRRIAVDAAEQCKGYGDKLMRQAIKYGADKGVRSGFLHADKLNDKAIRLYNKYGFFAKDGQGEINMLKQ